jgi:hypothetical protein
MWTMAWSTLTLLMYQVYEPSGHFHPHVDTPRSTSQFGSLVVCLPVEHSGGQLEVRHRGNNMTFDWSTPPSESPSIQWAAFYSDCEHEVLQVQSGYRVTLTYNLYAESVKEQVPDLTKIPLYQQLNDVLEQKEFMAKGIVPTLDVQTRLAFLTFMCILVGGWLGFYTTHAYPHTSESFTIDALKGLDLAMWHVFQALGCGVCLRPILVLEEDYSKSMHKFIGKSFHMAKSGHLIDYGEFKDLVKDWGLEKIDHEQVIWLNKMKGNKESQLAYITVTTTKFLLAYLLRSLKLTNSITVRK